MSLKLVSGVLWRGVSCGIQNMQNLFDLCLQLHTGMPCISSQAFFIANKFKYKNKEKMILPFCQLVLLYAKMFVMPQGLCLDG